MHECRFYREFIFEYDVGFNWDAVRKMTPPIVPQIVSKFDTSNFANSRKTYEEEETKNPFFSRASEGNDLQRRKGKNPITSETFALTRTDLLHEMNQEDIIKLE